MQTGKIGGRGAVGVGRGRRGDAGLLRGRAGAALCEALEARVMLAFDPTAREQFMLQLLNRFRADPVNELARLVSNLGTPARSSVPNIDTALNFFNVNGTLLAQQFASLTAVPPLAWNSDLYEAAEFHTNQQILYDVQSHQVTNPASNPGYVEPDLLHRAINSGYIIDPLAGYSLAENVFAFSEDPLFGHAGFVIDWGDNNQGAIGGIQNPPGHRDNMLSPAYSEVGIRILDDPVSQDRLTGPQVITQDFGRHPTQGNPFLLGATFADLDQDHFYSIGEGLAGVTVHVVGTGGSFTTFSMTAGGWQLQVPAGTYNVTFSGGQFGGPVTYSNIVVGSNNVEVDAPKGAAPPAPIAQVKGNGLVVPNGDTTPTSADFTGYGGVNITGQVLTRTFTIFNAGNAALSLTGVLSRVVISGVNAADFSLVQDALTTTLAPGASTTFKIAFNPSVLATRSATVTIATSDAVNPSYTFKIQGKGIARGVAQITGRGILVPDGQTAPSQPNATTFGSTPSPGGSSVRVYTITNTGAGVLNLLGANPITITGTGAAYYALSQAPTLTSLNPGETTTFRVRFNPLVLGAENATINVATSDALAAVYDFAVRGTGAPAPHLEVDNAMGTKIANGDLTPSLADRTNFGLVPVGGVRARWFTIKNTGFANLALTSPISVTLGGPDAGEFRLPSQPATLVLGPGGTIAFVIRFRPDNGLMFNATVTITSNDPFVGSYVFAISGGGLA